MASSSLPVKSPRPSASTSLIVSRPASCRGHQGRGAQEAAAVPNVGMNGDQCPIGRPLVGKDLGKHAKIQVRACT
jgi:hypothetical protein